MILRLPILGAIRSSLFLALCLLPVASVPAADLLWLAFLPKAERAKASGRAEAMDALRSTVEEDRSRSVEEERRYARTARLVASVLDRNGSFALELAAAGLPEGPSSREDAFVQLAEARRLRWKSAEELAGGTYGRPSAGGFRTASSREAEEAAAGKALSLLLSPRLKAAPAAALRKLTLVLEGRMAARRDCPPLAFAALRESSRNLDAAASRSWILALAEGTPAAIASSAALREIGKVGVPKTGVPGTGELTGTDVFSAALDAFVLRLSSRAALADALPAAAGAAWYVDLAASRAAPLTSPAPFIPPDPAALSSLAVFVRRVSESEADELAGVLSEDADFAASFSEALSLCWVAWTRSGERFAADLGMDGSIVKIALEKAWFATDGNPAGTATGSIADGTDPEGGGGPVDWDALIRAEAFAVEAESTSADASLLGQFAVLEEDAGAFSALRSGGRYASLRERLGAAYRTAVGLCLEAARSAAESGPSAEGTRPVPIGTHPPAEGARQVPGERPPVRFMYSLADGGEGRSGPVVLDPFSPLFVAALLQQASSDGGIVETPLAPILLSKSLAPAGTYPALIATIPFLCSAAAPSATELAMLDSGAAFSRNGKAGVRGGRAADAVRRLLERRPALIGLPVLLSAATRDNQSLSSFLSTAERFSRIKHEDRGRR